jgi:hypothetical protein
VLFLWYAAVEHQQTTQSWVYRVYHSSRGVQVLSFKSCFGGQGGNVAQKLPMASGNPPFLRKFVLGNGR